MQVDVTDRAKVFEMVEKTLEEFGKIDILVNNAGIYPVGPFVEIPVEEWNMVVDINLNGAFFCTRAVVPLMAKRIQGKIINISSGLGEIRLPRFCAYSVSKAGINQFTSSLSVELKEKNIQVNGVDPGILDTQMQDEIRAMGPDILGDPVHQVFLENKEKGYLKDPEDVAALAVFLGSNSIKSCSKHCSPSSVPLNGIYIVHNILSG